MTRKLYLFPDAPVQARARVLSVDSSGALPNITLVQTVFHVKGGGQQPDRGRIGNANVLDVRHGPNGTVDHFVDSVDTLEVGDEVELTVDAETRRRNSRLHTAGHLIAAVIESSFPSLHPVGAHHYPGECRVEFSAVKTALDDLQAQLPGLLSQAIDANYPVSVLGDPEVNRTIAIGAHRPIACGGTHVREVADLVHVDITGIKFKDGRLRISYSVRSSPEEELCIPKPV